MASNVFVGRPWVFVATGVAEGRRLTSRVGVRSVRGAWTTAVCEVSDSVAEVQKAAHPTRGRGLASEALTKGGEQDDSEKQRCEHGDRPGPAGRVDRHRVSCWWR